MKATLKILISAILILWAVSAVAETIPKAQFSTQISNREPVDDLTEIPNDFEETVYYFTDLRDCVGCKIEHRWIHDGAVVYTRESVSKYTRWRWWSGKSNLSSGKWTVEVLINGKHAMVDQLDVIEATPVVLQQAPIQYRMQKQAVSKCEQELEYWRTQLQDNPTEEYFQFKVYAWEKRCSMDVE